MKKCCNLPRVSVTLYLLVMVFSMSSRIDQNGVWSEMPLLVHYLPEYWALGSYVVIAAMVGNIAQWIFFFGNMYKPKIFRHVPAIYSVIIIGFIGCVLQAFFWKETAYIGGELHSVAFLTLVMFLSSVDHISSVAYFAFMVILPPEYMSAFYVGEGLCALIPSLVGLIQGAGEYDCVNVTRDVSGELYNSTNFEMKQIVRPPLFSVPVFFCFLAIIMAGSGIAFSIMNYHPRSKKFHLGTIIDKNEDKETRGVRFDSSKSECTLHTIYENSEDNKQIRPYKVEIDTESKMSKFETAHLMFLFSFVYGVRYGCLNPMQPYSLLPYGQVAYSLGNRLSNAMLPLASFVALFFPTRSRKWLTVLTFLGTLPVVYIMILAANSSYPPLHDTPEAGATLSVFAWLLMTACWGYAKVGISVRLREQGKKTLMVAGLVHHLAVLLLTIMTFFLTRAGYFKSTSPC